jgi:hypothetical protein
MQVDNNYEPASNKTGDWVIKAAIALAIIGVIYGVFRGAFTPNRAGAVPLPKVTICHATSSETNPYTRNVVSSNAIGGHFNNPGSPKAGHEDDLLLEGEVDCIDCNTNGYA